MEFNTSRYQFNHGKKPAPQLYGRWVFSLHARPLSADDTVYFTGTYTEAKRAARQHYQRHGVVASITVYVLP